MGQIEHFWCLSDREFPEFFKTHPTFDPSPFQKAKKGRFLGHPVYIIQVKIEVLI